jgi:OmpA-OmpF porin, OOP family
MMRGHAADTSDPKVLRGSWAEPPFPPPPEPLRPPPEPPVPPPPFPPSPPALSGEG